MFYAALKNAAIDVRRDLTEDEENSVVLKEIKQTQETLDTTPAERTDIIEQCRLRISVYQEFAPRLMNEEEIRAVILEVLEILQTCQSDSGLYEQLRRSAYFFSCRISCNKEYAGRIFYGQSKAGKSAQSGASDS